MENFTLEETPPPGGPGGAQTPQGIGPPQSQQLPPQMFTTAAQLLDLTDKKLMVCLRDGRKLIGVLRSWDQFANLILQSTTERIFVPMPAPPNSTGPPSAPHGLYADIPRGVFLIRGENVLLLGEIDLDKDDDDPPGYVMGEVELVHKLAKENKIKEARKEKMKLKRLAELGFEGENSGEALM